MALTETETGSRFAGLLQWAAKRPRLVLVALCLVLWAPGVLSLPPLDRDESRFAQASKQMLETGDLVDIRFGHVPRYKKPAGIYWMQSATTALAGFGSRTHIWTYRLPSLIGGIAAVLLTFWCAGAFLRREAALLAAALLGGTLLLTGEASIATTDAVLTASILGAEAVLLRIWLAAKGGAAPPSRLTVLAGWVCLGLTILVKGPPVFIPLLTAALLCLWNREWRWLKGTNPVTGIALVVLMVAPWVIAIGLKSHWQFFQQSLGQDFATKLQGGQESHGFPPGYFLIALTPSFWPAILFLAPALVQAFRARRNPAIQFLLVWLAGWVLFELVPTKLPHYVLPLYPALAILTALWVLAPRPARTIWDKLVFFLAPVQFALVAAALAAALIWLPVTYGDGLALWTIVPAILLAALSMAALVFYFRGQTLRAGLLVVVLPLTVYPVLTAGVAPYLSQIWVSPRLTAAMASFHIPTDPPPALAGYIEPSMLFLTGTDTRLTDGGAAAADAGAAEGGLAAIEERQMPAFSQRLKEREVEAAEVGRIDGFSYSNGRKVHIHLWRVMPLTETPPPPAE